MGTGKMRYAPPKRGHKDKRSSAEVFAKTGAKVTDPETGETVATVIAEPGLRKQSLITEADFDWHGGEPPKKGQPVDFTPGFRTFLCADGGRRAQVHIGGVWVPVYEVPS